MDSFYVGSTSEPVQIRLDRHNSFYYDDKWTAKGVPWELYLSIPCVNMKQATSIEAHIKRMKSRVYIENLMRYPEMIDKLLSKYSPH